MTLDTPPTARPVDVRASVAVAVAQHGLVVEDCLGPRLRDGGLDLVGTFPEARSACRAAATRRAVAVVDTNNADGPLDAVLDGLGVDRPPIVVFAARLGYDAVLRLAGRVDGFVLHHDPLDELIAVIGRVAKGERADSPSAAEFLNRPAEGPPEPLIPPVAANLTKRQIDILRLLATGATVKEVARQTYRSPKSIDGHKYRIMKVLGLKDRVELAHFAIAAGLVEPRYELLRRDELDPEDTIAG